jgi:hypothetical protein
VKFLTKDPLDAARDSLVKLTDRLAVAAESVKERLKTARRLAVDGADDKALDVAEAAVRAARDRVDTLTIAIREVENTISVLEAEQAAAADQKVRAATVVELEAIERDLTKTADEFTHAAKKLSEIAGKISPFIVDATGLAIFAASAGGEVPPNVTMLKSLLRIHASAVISGHGRATLPQPAPTPQPVQPPAPKVEVVSIKNVAFHDGNVIRTAHPGHKLALIPAVATQALEIGACVEPTDPRAAFHAGQKKLTVPNIENCVALDSRAAIAAAEPRGVVEPIRRSAPPGIADASRPLQQAASRALPLPPGFEPLDRGPAYTVRVPAGNPAPGQENDDE